MTAEFQGTLGLMGPVSTHSTPIKIECKPIEDRYHLTFTYANIEDANVVSAELGTEVEEGNKITLITGLNFIDLKENLKSAFNCINVVITE